MKKCMLIILGLVTAVTAMAQDLSPYKAYQIKQNVKVEILEIKRVEKYGWDNLEVKYRLTNKSNYDLQKVDFLVHLLDENDKEIGSIELFAFKVPKSSSKKYKSVDILSPYVNAEIANQLVETKQLDVLIDNQESMVSIKSSQDLNLK
ncbi:hypothetical protein [Reichenbachiella agariperforans]|uniref:hypothetical protein n=1 Tax=Reichenbachiella agariperforans TaxID=156994 RepID=UPI001C09A26D|nr:hypothetical protein [Reichenbachiella agariperforans]MBU2913997.1 hypothetical protein [Reichenbachiella agariperforans]